MDRPWLIAIAVLTALLLIVLKSYVRARLGYGLFAGNGPGSGRFVPALLVAALAITAGFMVAFTGNWWWLLLGAPSVGLAFYLAHLRRQAGVASGR